MAAAQDDDDAFLFAGLPSDPARWPAPAATDAKKSKPKLRSACDFCHAAKVKCSGEPACCARCRGQELPCSYSYAMRAGKPKGSRNRKTLEKQARLRQQYAATVSRTTLASPRNDWQAMRPDLDLDLPPASSSWWGVGDCTAGMDDSAGMMDVGYLSGAFDGGVGGGADQVSGRAPPPERESVPRS